MYNPTMVAKDLCSFSLNNKELIDKQEECSKVILDYSKKFGYSIEKSVDIWYKFEQTASVLYRKQKSVDVTISDVYNAAVYMERYKQRGILTELNNIKNKSKMTKLDIYKNKQTIGHWSFGLAILEVKEIINGVDDYIVAVYNAWSDEATLHKLKVYNTDKGSYVNFNKKRLYMSDCIRH